MKNLYWFVYFSKWQDMRNPWFIMSIIMISLVLIAHFLFQEYLYIRPCEQCVYIRLDMLIIALGGIIALINPKNTIIKILAYTLAFYGIWLGLEHSLNLNRIHEAISTENPFSGVNGCRDIPLYPFNLPLHERFPSWFKPVGQCGMDFPMVPKSAYLNAFQEFFVGKNGIYNNGWYLIPSLKFMNMATCCFIAFLCSFILLFIMFVSYVFSQRKIIFTIITISLVVALKILG
ncbi:protein-disulfide oxidoreductase DsbI [Campylobacter coli]|nr:protein-disulfide oxidoreductase DsbI [Campylobacter coli]